MLKKTLKKMQIISEEAGFSKLREEAFKVASKYLKDEKRVFDYLLCTEEIFSNSYLHGYDMEKGVVYVSVYMDGKYLVTEMKDEGKGIEEKYVHEVPELEAESLLAESGRGLFIVENLADKLQIRKNNKKGTIVTFYFERI